jgi:hypothetical protein
VLADGSRRGESDVTLEVQHPEERLARLTDRGSAVLGPAPAVRFRPGAARSGVR